MYRKYPISCYKTTNNGSESLQVSLIEHTTDDILIWIANELAEANRLKTLELQDKLRKSPLLDEVVKE